MVEKADDKTRRQPISPRTVFFHIHFVRSRHRSRLPSPTGCDAFTEITHSCPYTPSELFSSCDILEEVSIFRQESMLTSSLLWPYQAWQKDQSFVSFGTERTQVPLICLSFLSGTPEPARDDIGSCLAWSLIETGSTAHETRSLPP